MTTEEIKQEYSMSDILTHYGVHTNRSGFVPCPFHKEKTASMRIYKDSYHCFGCGENGDIFTFIQKMDDVSFKEAFLSLGGTYEKPTYQSKLAVYRHRQQRETDRRRRVRETARKRLNNTLIDVYRYWMNRSEPLSDAWCECFNALQRELRMHERLNRDEVGGWKH